MPRWVHGNSFCRLVILKPHLAQINGCSRDARQPSTVRLLVSSSRICSPSQSQELERRRGEQSSQISRDSQRMQGMIYGLQEGRVGERERGKWGPIMPNETWFAAILPFLCVFPGCLPGTALQLLLLCVLMHKFRSSTKAWFLYSSQERVMFLSIHNEKSRLIWLMTLFFLSLMAETLFA